MNKKLLIIGSSLNYGSPGHICEELGLIAMTDGWDVYHAHGLKYARASKLKTHAVCSRLGEFKHTFGSLLFDSHGLCSKAETIKFVEWISNISPDIIHLHNLHGYYLNYEILFNFLSNYNKPIVWTLHDFWPITGHCAHFDFIGCDKWKYKCEQCPQISAYPRALIDRSKRNFIKKRCCFTSIKNMTIVPVSNWVGDLVSKSFLAKYPICPIYNGVDLNIFQPVENDLRDRFNLHNKFVLLGVASPWYELKGLSDYFKLAKIMPEDYRIIMIGLTKKQIAHLPQKIIGVERTTDQFELTRFYSMADVTLNLSYQETFGMTTAESMACGTPVISYDRTASPELLSPDTGYVVAAGDIASIITSCKKIKLKDAELYNTRCRDRAKALFNKDYQFQQYLQLYNSLYEECQKN